MCCRNENIGRLEGGSGAGSTSWSQPGPSARRRLVRSAWRLAARAQAYRPDEESSGPNPNHRERCSLEPVREKDRRKWTAADLRKYLVREIEEHVEHRLTTVTYLEGLD